MPRNSTTGVYTYPVGTPGVSNQTIASSPYNTFLDDLALDLNTPRPIVAGGTGASSAVTAMQAMNGEIANQVITNYDGDTLYSGSFSSASTASGEPVNGHAFSGIIYRTDANNIVVEARDATDGKKYIRRKISGSWGAWAAELAAPGDPVTTGNTTVSGTLSVSGISTLSTTNVNGNLNVSGTITGTYALTSLGSHTVTDATGGKISLNRPTGSYLQNPGLHFTTAGSNRWRIFIGSNSSLDENGGGIQGADFIINKYNDSGGLSLTCMELKRQSQEVWFYGDVRGKSFIVTGLVRDGKEEQEVNLLQLVDRLQERIAALEERLEAA